jgi:GNAT superfamily N-acetyltransferase
MDDAIFAVQRAEFAQVASLMDRAFSADPIARWVLADHFGAEHHRFVRLCAEPAFDLDAVHAVTGFTGAAIWHPPDVGFDEHAVQDWARSSKRCESLARFFELAEACATYKPTEPHWELELIAVDPVRQGCGIGSKLLKHGLEGCSRDGAPVYLQSSNPENLSFYRRHGFELLAEVRLSGTPPLYPMLLACK